MVPVIAAVAKSVAANAVKGIAKDVVKGAAKETVKGAVKETAKSAVKDTAKDAVKSAVTSPKKQKIGMELMGDSEANTYAGKKSFVGSKLKAISKNLKEKAKKALDGEGDGKSKEWSKRGPIVTGSNNSTGDDGAFDEQISKLKNLQ